MTHLDYLSMPSSQDQLPHMVIDLNLVLILALLVGMWSCLWRAGGGLARVWKLVWRVCDPLTVPPPPAAALPTLEKPTDRFLLHRLFSLGSQDCLGRYQPLQPGETRGWSQTTFLGRFQDQDRHRCSCRQNPAKAAPPHSRDS